jgi:hypothetical protein
MEGAERWERSPGPIRRDAAGGNPGSDPLGQPTLPSTAERWNFLPLSNPSLVTCNPTTQQALYQAHHQTSFQTTSLSLPGRLEK